MTKLTLLLTSVYGSAYFTDEVENLYFRPTGGQPIRALVTGVDDRFTRILSEPHPLAEIGREFESPIEADQYMGALAKFSEILRLSVFSADPQSPEEQRIPVAGLVARLQERIKKEDLPLLETIPEFRPLKKYLDMTPEQIYLEQKNISYLF